jgi:hypothetical protein
MYPSAFCICLSHGLYSASRFPARPFSGSTAFLCFFFIKGTAACQKTEIALWHRRPADFPAQADDLNIITYPALFRQYLQQILFRFDRIISARPVPVYWKYDGIFLYALS